MADEYELRMKRRIGQNIKRIRTSHGWTQYRLASTCGLAWHTIQKWEQGVSEPSVVKLMKLCRRTGWKLSDILKGRDADELGDQAAGS